MLGTFAPQREPYIHTLEEETTPSGVLARGNYTAKLRVGSFEFIHYAVSVPRSDSILQHQSFRMSSMVKEPVSCAKICLLMVYITDFAVPLIAGSV